MLIGGAVLSGVFFGDRCSPVSTSALLVAELTQTSIFDNIRAMLRTSWLPFVLTSLLYLFVGMATPHTQTSLDLAALFETEFQPDPPAVQGRPAQSGGDRHRPGGYSGGSGAADPLVHRGRSAAGLGGSAYGQHLFCLFPLSAASLAAGNGASKGKM